MSTSIKFFSKDIPPTMLGKYQKEKDTPMTLRNVFTKLWYAAGPLIPGGLLNKETGILLSASHSVKTSSSQQWEDTKLPFFHSRFSSLAFLEHDSLYLFSNYKTLSITLIGLQDMSFPGFQLTLD